MTLLTGATGFLGRHVLAHLRAGGAPVTVFAQSPVPGVATWTGDLTSPLPWSQTPAGISVLYHVAGFAHRRIDSQQDRDLCLQVNLHGLRRLLETLVRDEAPLQAVVLISSVSVYGIESGERIDEDFPCAPSDPYGQSKWMAEQFLQDWASRHHVRAAILRLPLVVGGGSVPGNLGALVQAIRSGRYVPVGTGTARRSMVWAGDVACALPIAAAVGGTYNLTDGSHPSVAELESAIASSFHKPGFGRRVPQWIARAAASLGDAVQAAGIRAPFTSRTLSKLTATLTFSDVRARECIEWRPSPVLEHIAELAQT